MVDGVWGQEEKEMRPHIVWKVATLSRRKQRRATNGESRVVKMEAELADATAGTMGVIDKASPVTICRLAPPVTLDA